MIARPNGQPKPAPSHAEALAGIAARAVVVQAEHARLVRRAAKLHRAGEVVIAEINMLRAEAELLERQREVVLLKAGAADVGPTSRDPASLAAARESFLRDARDFLAAAEGAESITGSPELLARLETLIRRYAEVAPILAPTSSAT